LNGFYQARAEFGGRLRRLREEAGLNGKQFAVRLGWAASKVSRIETGKQTATSDDVTAWAEATGTEQSLLDDLLADLRTVRFEYATWTRQFRAGTAARQRVSVEIEGTATTMRALETTVIPGLLQTADYARHVLGTMVAMRDVPDDVADGVRLRMRRQEVLYDPAKHFRFLLTEAALRTRTCPPTTLRGQLDRLLALSGVDTVELAVLPFDLKLPVVPSHGFWIFDEDIVLIETLSAELTLRDSDEVALYDRIFEMLWDVAVRGDDLAVFLRELIEGLRRAPEVGSSHVAPS
jgi:transcriptional regulator with XRE-family HTH domain